MVKGMMSSITGKVRGAVARDIVTAVKAVTPISQVPVIEPKPYYVQAASTPAQMSAIVDSTDMPLPVDKGNAGITQSSLIANPLLIGGVLIAALLLVFKKR